jgi:hypothetical protein
MRAKPVTIDQPQAQAIITSAKIHENQSMGMPSRARTSWPTPISVLP